jgi:hypothetical protein
MYFQPSASVTLPLTEHGEIIEGSHVASGEGERWPFWAGGGFLDSLQRLASTGIQPASNPTIAAGAASRPESKSPASVSKLVSALPAVEPSPAPAIAVSLRCQDGTGANACNGVSTGSAMSREQPASRSHASVEAAATDSSSLTEALASTSNVAASASKTQLGSLQPTSEHPGGQQSSSKGGLAGLLHLPEFSFQVPGFQDSRQPTAAQKSAGPPAADMSTRTATTPGRQAGSDRPPTKGTKADPALGSRPLT